jgi:hypothetical protein
MIATRIMILKRIAREWRKILFQTVLDLPRNKMQNFDLKG